MLTEPRTGHRPHFGRVLGALLLALLCVGPTLANEGNETSRQLDQAGLKVQWFSHTGVGLRSNLVDWCLYIDENRSTTYFEISAGNYKETLSERDRDPSGNEYGLERGLELAKIRMEIVKAEMAAAGQGDVEVQLNQYALPKSTLYILTSDSSVRAIDADSGQTLWDQKLRVSGQPLIGLDASDQYVAVVNGSELFCLDAEIGKLLWSRKCQSAVSAPPAVKDRDIYVPLFNGRLEKFAIQYEGFNSTAFVASGRSSTKPAVTSLSVAWGSTDGDLNVAPRWGTRARLAYQLRTERPILSTPVFSDGMYYATSTDGFVYALMELRGTLAWEVSTGQPISQPPVVFGSSVFVINDALELFKLDRETGKVAAGWETPRQGIRRFVGASKSAMYVIDELGNLRILNPESGTTINTIAVGDVQQILPNTQTDRMYFANSKGTIRCVRELASVRPYFHDDEQVPEPGQPASSPEQRPAGADNPFAQDNPFAKPPAAAQDPADNPFANPNPPASQDNSNRQPAADDDPFK